MNVYAHKTVNFAGSHFKECHGRVEGTGIAHAVLM